MVKTFDDMLALAQRTVALQGKDKTNAIAEIRIWIATLIQKQRAECAKKSLAGHARMMVEQTELVEF